MNLKKLHLILLLAILATTVSAQGQQNVTKYITNPSFENSTTGWVVSGLGSQTNNEFPKKDGAVYIEKWVGSGNSVGNGSARQTLSNLPMGVYRLTVGAQNLDQKDTSRKCSGAYIFAGTKKTTVYTADDYSVEFTYVAGDVEIGYVAEGAQGNWIAVDNFRLYRIGDVSVDDAKGELSKVLGEANKYYGDGSGNAAADLKKVIDAAQALYDDTAAEVAAVEAAISQLKAAIDAYRQQNVSEENPLDKTSYINDPSFEKGATGWKVENLSSQSNSAFTKKSGTYYMEKWTGSGYVGDGYAKQTITNLPIGVYKLTVGAQNYDQQNTSSKCTGTYIYAGDQREPVYTPADYSVKFTNITGEVEIGYVAENASGNWIAVDNFRLYLIGKLDGEGVLSEVQRLIAAAENLEIPAEIASTYQRSQQLTDALTAARQLTGSSTDAEISKAIKNLQKAIADEEVLIEKALFAYRIANATEGTGTAPQVTSTNHYVATGATQALMRATMTGSNIMERGVCWSTEREPTVLDNRTTKSFSLNGYIFHVKDLKPSTVYYLRPYIINKTYQVAYGDEVKIVTHPKGTCVGTWNGGAPDEAANSRCSKAIQQTIEYFNEWTGIMGFTLSGNYGSGTPTADCSYGGWMRIGPSASYQAIGTVLHETGHGVGVGTHIRWYECAETRENTTRGKWLGREANDVLRFLENNYNPSQVYFTGDVQHGWGWGDNNGAYIHYDWLVNGADKDRHEELQYIGGMCILHGLFIDGLDPTSSNYWETQHNGISGYTYNFDDNKKYYLMNKNSKRGLGSGVIYQRTANGSIGWKENLLDEALNDSAAWYMEFDPVNCYYSFRNAATGNYLSHVTGLSSRSVSKVSSSEWFQLMPDRTDVTVGIGNAKINTHGYWLTWKSGSFMAMGAGIFVNSNGYGSVIQSNFNYSNSATDQQWILISEDELADYRAAAISTGIHQVELPDAEQSQAVYDLQGRMVANPGRGFYIKDGKKVVIR